MLTKRDEGIIDQKLNALESKVDTKLTKLESNFDEKLAQMEARLEQKFLTKTEFFEFKDDLFAKLDDIASYMQTQHQEEIVLSYRQSEHTDQIENLTKRLTIVEHKLEIA